MACKRCPGVNLCPCTVREGKSLMWLDIMGRESYHKEGLSAHPDIVPSPRRPRLWEE
jgi:hypothetical protein